MRAGFDLAAALAVLAALAGDAAADSQHDMACPSPAELKAELARVGAEGVTPPRIDLNGDRMRVVLYDRRGVPVGAREVEAAPTCRERATAAAVLVATWMGIWPQAPNAPTTESATPTPVLADEHRTEIGLTLDGAYDGNVGAFGLTLEARRRLLDALWATLAVGGTTERERSLGGVATAGYLRPAVALGPALRVGHDVQVDVAAAGRLGLVIVYGKDLPVQYTKFHVIPGVSANVRLLLPGQRFSPFIAVAGTWWIGTQALTLDDVKASAELPRWDLAAGLGCFWSP
jgi:hypothetical protein